MAALLDCEDKEALISAVLKDAASEELVAITACELVNDVTTLAVAED